jgi:FAD/FMN-containing dehydrogenase
VVAPQTGLASEDCDAWHVLFSLRGHEADVTEMRSAIPRLAEQHGGTIAACLDREASTRLWRAVPEPFALLEPDFAALKVTVPPGEVLAPAHEALFGCGSSTPLVRISLGSGMIHVTLPDLAGDADSWRQYAESVARTASSAGGWLSVDRPAGRAAEMVAHRVGAGGPACDRISAAIKRAFDPAGVLPAIPS